MSFTQSFGVSFLFFRFQTVSFDSHWGEELWEWSRRGIQKSPHKASVTPFGKIWGCRQIAFIAGLYILSCFLAMIWCFRNLLSVMQSQLNYVIWLETQFAASREVGSRSYQKLKRAKFSGPAQQNSHTAGQAFATPTLPRVDFLIGRISVSYRFYWWS